METPTMRFDVNVKDTGKVIYLGLASQSHA